MYVCIYIHCANLFVDIYRVRVYVCVPHARMMRPLFLPGCAHLTNALRTAAGMQVNERVSQELNHLVQSLGEIVLVLVLVIIVIVAISTDIIVAQPLGPIAR